MNLKVILGSFIVIVLFFFGIIFALASSASEGNPVRLAVAAILFVAGFGVISVLYLTTKKPSEIVHRVELSGEMKAVSIECPECGASIPPNKIRIVDGVPYATCGYCGNTIEVAEEPKW